MQIVLVIVIVVVAIATSKDSREVSFSGFSFSGLNAVDTNAVDTNAVDTTDVQPCPPANANSVEIRSYLYAHAVREFMQNPILGIGANMFGATNCFGVYGYPHSTIIQAFAELGFLGGALLVYMYFFSIYTLAIVIGCSNKRSKSFGYTDHDFFTQMNYLMIFSFLLFYLVADQIYGNYFTSAAAFLCFGLVSSVANENKRMKREGT